MLAKTVALTLELGLKLLWRIVDKKNVQMIRRIVQVPVSPDMKVIHNKAFAQCNGLAILAPVKSPDTGRTSGILMERPQLVATCEDEIYVRKR